MVACLTKRASEALRDELAQVAHELNADSIEQVVYARVLRLPSQPLPIIGSGNRARALGDCG
ncbi:hypothetical protein LNO78_14295 [Klebsiella pneumoniae subsp. pneumoniae]|nr:hypothetical protein [Klebsiella pneumoniae subsp. pneumoniae]